MIITLIVDITVVKLVALFVSMKKGCSFKEAEAIVREFCNDNIIDYLNINILGVPPAE